MQTVAKEGWNFVCVVTMNNKIPISRMFIHCGLSAECDRILIICTHEDMSYVVCALAIIYQNVLQIYNVVK